jgi:signal transduction histidine kinase
MSAGFSSRPFREARLLIGATLLLLVGMVGVQTLGMVAVSRVVERETRRDATAAAQMLAARLARGESARFAASLREAGWGLAVLADGVVIERIGRAGPFVPAWWPWTSQQDWIAHGRAVAGPLLLEGENALVAYQPLADGRVVRAVVAVASAGAVGRWRTLGSALAVLVAIGGGLLAWALVVRVLAPYRELLAEAVRVTQGPGGRAEDRFLVETFRETVGRLELSEAALRRRADELEVLADVLTRETEAGVVITEPGGTVRAANETARTLLGGVLTVGEALPPVLASKASRITHLGRVVEARRFPLLAASGSAQGEVIFLTDRTALEALERALKEREQMASLGELAAGMTHELRNALATMRGYLRLLPEAARAERARFIAAINDEAEGLESLLDRFLRFAQPEHLLRERVDLLALAREAAAKVGAAFPGTEIAVAGVGASTAGDAMALGIAVENLLRNAAEAVSRGGSKVTARVEEGVGTVAVVVEDDGPGVGSELRERLFLPFASSKPSGGLGLPLARRFARLHGGDVEFEPRPGGGARFTLRLPREGVP